MLIAADIDLDAPIGSDLRNPVRPPLLVLEGERLDESANQPGQLHLVAFGVIDVDKFTLQHAQLQFGHLGLRISQPGPGVRRLIGVGSRCCTSGGRDEICKPLESGERVDGGVSVGPGESVAFSPVDVPLETSAESVDEFSLWHSLHVREVMGLFLFLLSRGDRGHFLLGQLPPGLELLLRGENQRVAVVLLEGLDS